MSDDPKSDLIKKSGPLGIASSVSPDQARHATDPQAVIMYQNDEQMKAIGRLEGTLSAFVKIMGDDLGEIKKRVGMLEVFNYRLILIPRALYGIISIGGIGATISALCWIGHILGITK